MPLPRIRSGSKTITAVYVGYLKLCNLLFICKFLNFAPILFSLPEPIVYVYWNGLGTISSLDPVD